MEQSSERPSQALRRLVNGYQISQAIHVAATLGVADLLADGPRASDDLAAATGSNSEALYRLLRALASVGVFHEEEGRRFSLTPLGDCLRADAPEPVGGWAAFVRRPYVWRAWGELLHAVTAGEVAFVHMHGTDAWAYRASHPDENAIFDRAMTANSRRQAAAILAAYDFGRFRRIVDMGGGRGALLAVILARHPEGCGVLFDQPHIVADAGPVLAAAGVAERCEVIGGDFFRSVPAGGDAYVLRAILHDWEDGDATAILRTVRGAMASEARLLLIERIVAPRTRGRTRSSPTSTCWWSWGDGSGRMRSTGRCARRRASERWGSSARRRSTASWRLSQPSAPSSVASFETGCSALGGSGSDWAWYASGRGDCVQRPLWAHPRAQVSARMLRAWGCTVLDPVQNGDAVGLASLDAILAAVDSYLR